MIILGARTISRSRRPVGTRGTDGRWSEGTATTTSISAAVQPAPGDVVALLPEGLRTRRALVVVTESDLIATDQTTGRRGDLLTIDGEHFEVASVQRFDAVLPHYSAVAVRA